MIIDSHAHIYWRSYNLDFEAVLERARKAQVSVIINVGTDLVTSQQASSMVSDKVDFYSTIGIHPHEGVEMAHNQPAENLILNLKSLYQKNQAKVVAIGECGLDYHFENSLTSMPTQLKEAEVKNYQQQLFGSQAILAKELDLPLVIHCRDAWDDIFIPEISGLRGVFHNFSSSSQNAQKALSLNFYLSFSCVITYPKNQPLRDLITQLPLDRILTETDCPFLPPQQIRGQRNEPSYVTEVIKTIAEVKSLSFEQVANTTYANAKRLFKLK